jgi:hypothetical protein
VLVGVLLIGLGCCGTVAGINALADSSPSKVDLAVILEKREERRSKGGRSYRVKVRVRDGQGTMTFNVSRRDFGRIVPGQSKLELTTGKGSLGIVWLKNKRVLP